jgi:hypothetical protein
MGDCGVVRVPRVGDPNEEVVGGWVADDPGWSKGDVIQAESCVATLNAYGKVAFTFRPQGGPTAISDLDSRALCYRGGRLGQVETG